MIKRYKTRLHFFSQFSKYITPFGKTIVKNNNNNKVQLLQTQSSLFEWLWEWSKCYLLSFALLICKCAKLTSLSIKIKTTLAKEEIGQILSFVCKHEEQKYTNGSSMILHYGPLQVLKIIQGAISSKVENLPGIPSHTPFISGEFRSKILSTERGFWNDFYFLNLVQVLSMHCKRVQYTLFHF